MPTPPKTDTRDLFPDRPITATEWPTLRNNHGAPRCLRCGGAIRGHKGRICDPCQGSQSTSRKRR
jgi:hypothetical protein